MSEDRQSLYGDLPGMDLAGARIAIVHALWNQAIVGELLAGCERILQAHGVGPCERIPVPGAFELTFACRRYIETHEGLDALIALGCVIRGETPHFDYICRSVTDGLTRLNLRGNTPLIFGVLTVDTEAQARERAGGSRGHKGEEAALAALRMVALNRGWMK